jgi:ariadne-1
MVRGMIYGDCPGEKKEEKEDVVFFPSDVASSFEGDIENDLDQSIRFSSYLTDTQWIYPYSEEYVVYSTSDILILMNQEIQHTTAVTQMSESHVISLLIREKWQKEEVIEAFMEKSAKMILVEAQLLPESFDYDDGERDKKKLIQFCQHFSCDICGETFTEGTYVIRPYYCDHAYCRLCYEQYLKIKIMDEGEIKRIPCPSAECHLILEYGVLYTVIADMEDVKHRMNHLLLKSFVEDCHHQRFKWCSAPGCNFILEYRLSSLLFVQWVPVVVCRCGHRFCFKCLREDHRPATCLVLERWLKKYQNDSETYRWIIAHTKLCPNCRVAIEKNGGCNHIICKRCKHEFCWVCSGPWSEHKENYQCNRYHEKASEEARSLQAQSEAHIKRYMHYYNRYTNQEQSSRLDKKRYLMTEITMDQIQLKTDLSWIDVQFLQRAVDIVIECRITLKYTYVLAYYLKYGNLTEIFEDNQRDLELATEQLGALLEQLMDNPVTVTHMKQSIVDKSAYCASRRDLILADTAKGLAEDRWELTLEAYS